MIPWRVFSFRLAANSSNCLWNEGWGFVRKRCTCSETVLFAVFERDTLLNSSSSFLSRFPFEKSWSGVACLSSFERASNATSDFSYKVSSIPKSNEVFLVKTTVFLGRYFKKLSRCSSNNLFSTLGMMLIFSKTFVESCVSISKVRRLSTSSPKNSIRYGSSFEKENTSMSPPRTENSPGSETKSTLLKS